MKIFIIGQDGTLEAEYDHPAVLPDAVIAIDGYKGTVSGSPEVEQVADPDGGPPHHEVKKIKGKSKKISELL